jgi:hypothetical protein
MHKSRPVDPFIGNLGKAMQPAAGSEKRKKCDLGDSPLDSLGCRKRPVLSQLRGQDKNKSNIGTLIMTGNW